MREAQALALFLFISSFFTRAVSRALESSRERAMKNVSSFLHSHKCDQVKFVVLSAVQPFPSRSSSSSSSSAGSRWDCQTRTWISSFPINHTFSHINLSFSQANNLYICIREFAECLSLSCIVACFRLSRTCQPFFFYSYILVEKLDSNFVRFERSSKSHNYFFSWNIIFPWDCTR